MPALVSGTSIDSQANEILEKYKKVEQSPQAWFELLEKVISHSLPIDQIKALYNAAYEGWDEKVNGPRIFKQAVDPSVRKTNLAAAVEKLNEKYGEKLTIENAYDFSVKNPRKWYVTMLRDILDIPLKDNTGKDFRLDEKNLVRVGNLLSKNGELDYEFAPDGWFNPVNAIEKNALKNPDAIARTNADLNGNVTTYTNKQFFEKICQAANMLVAEGVKPDQFIPISTRMGIEHEVLKYASMAVGAVPVLIPNNIAAGEFEKYLSEMPSNKIAPISIVHDVAETKDGSGHHHDLYEKYRQAKGANKFIVISSQSSSEAFQSKLQQGDEIFNFEAKKFLAQPNRFNIVQRKLKDAFSVIGSSGTTTVQKKEGDYTPPKLIEVNGGIYLDYAISWNLYADVKPGEKLSQLAGTAWMMQELSSFGTIANNANYCISESPVVSKEYAKYIEQQKVDVVVLSPKIAEAIQKLGLFDDLDLNVRTFISSGGKSNPDNFLWLGTRVNGGSNLIEVMGGTEQNISCAGVPDFDCVIGTFNTLEFGRKIFIANSKHDLVKKDKATDTEYFIVMNPECPPLGLSMHGVNFDNTKKYYHKDQVVDGAQLREHGDGLQQVYANRKPYFISLGRVDDMLKINDQAVAPEQLEDFIREDIKAGRLKGIADVICFGYNPGNLKSQQDVIYAVQLDNSDSGSFLKNNEKQICGLIRNAVKNHRPSLAVVDGAMVMDSLPITATGKSKRAQLRVLWPDNQKKTQLTNAISLN